MSDRESWKSFLVVGVLFPAHVVLGVASVPTILYLLVTRNTYGVAFLVLYLPFYLWPAATRYPGWKGFDLMWKYFDYTNTCREYFGRFEVSLAGSIDPDGQYFVACHPHGTLIFQRCFWRSELTTDVFRRGFRMLAASVLFRIPVVREMTLFFGGVDASRKNCESLLRRGASIVLFPGGLDEMPRAADGADAPVHVRTRTGFIRLAVKHGVPVVPTFCFGELEAVSAVSPLPSAIAKWLRRNFRMSTTAFIGRWMLPMPHRVPFYLCIGKPISVKQCSDLDAIAEVERVHDLYKQELKAIYEANRERCGYSGRALVFDCEIIARKHQ